MGTIRFLLALSVLIVHSSSLFGLQLLPGYLAVQSFYIISGFYMAFIYCEKYSKTERPAYNFYVNRFFRLYPLYILIVFLTIGLSLVFGIFLGDFGKLQFYITEYQKNHNSIYSLITFLVLNFSLIGQDILTFFSLDEIGRLSFSGLQTNITIQEYLFIPIAWTISVELFFYLLTPLVANKKLNFILLMIFIVIGIRLILFQIFDVFNEFAIYRFAPTEFFWFLLGIVSYRLKFLRTKWIRKFSFALFLIMIISFLLYRFFAFDWIVLTLVFLFTPSIFDHFHDHKADRYIGELTYPLYLGHCFFLLIISANHFPKPFGTGPPAFLLTILFSVFIYHYFQKPLDKWRFKRLVSESDNIKKKAE
jgi:peptidoglycan/LPS O-acetylase OafA/YrhL